MLSINPVVVVVVAIVVLLMLFISNPIMTNIASITLSKKSSKAYDRPNTKINAHVHIFRSDLASPYTMYTMTSYQP